MTTKMPTPIAIPPTRTKAFKNSLPEIIVTCFETIKIDGSAHVINSPKANENKMTIKIFFCLESDEPIYSPTLLNDEDAPIWKRANPKIKTIIPMSNKMMFDESWVVIFARFVKCKIKTIAIIGTIEREDDNNAFRYLFFIVSFCLSLDQIHFLVWVLQRFFQIQEGLVLQIS